jgi:cyclopropane fatty-acyl-phospholipid synthase-like methyltransferase
MTPINYKDNFHNVHFQNSLNSAKEVVPLFLSYYKPQNVLDVGCGLGTWLSVFQENQCDVFGIDGDYVKIEDLKIDKNRFKDHDLNFKFDLQRKFDLVTSLEVAEHILPANAKSFIDSLCAHGNIVLFSAAIPGQEGTLHHNEQYNDYWITLFSQNDYKCIDFFRHEIWNNKNISWWYRQNILIFIKNSEIKNSLYELITKQKSQFQNSYIHPELFAYKCAKVNKLEKLVNSPSQLVKYYFKIVKSKFKKNILSNLRL